MPSPYYTYRWALKIQKLLDHMRNIEPKAFQFSESADSASAFTLRNQFYQGSKYLVDKVPGGEEYRELRSRLVFTLSPEIDNHRVMTIDWKLPEDRLRNEDKEDIEQLFAKGKAVNSLRAANVGKAKAQLAEARTKARKVKNEKPDLGVVPEELPNSHMDRLIEYLENAPYESPALVFENLTMTDNQVEQANMIIEGYEDILSEVTNFKIFVQKTRKVNL